ncbi:long-chain fatty acid--CoA ligase [Azomonas macrocytogenes]|uniref:Long-chain-fatty-acid--CoA ligase n=1 Tax=Azomonas macrocytogenes TaxID=69962 RepID=A0A839T6R6_AZOMA|nr:long-chain fatty acid--CoA ligase [Azomonas macrocytogenes]MBB3104769.1 long-chain acyl-CoA synthetase [Azomonas macrocytogenes]
MTDNFWMDKYPPGISSEIHPETYRNIQSVLRVSCERFASKTAFSNLGRSLTYHELYELSGHFAAYLQKHTDLKPGDRIAIQLPNVIQYPIVVFGALRAGLVVVNTNPLYTAREMEQQFKDSGARGLICLANMAHRVQEVLPATDIRHVVITEIGDMLSMLKGFMVNAVVRHVKKLVPAYHLPHAVPFRKALSLGQGEILTETDSEPNELAILQYTGGTTGVPKGAMLSHRNIIANMLQCRALVGSELRDGCETAIAPLPLYHVYAFTLHCMVMVLIGAHNVLITNPRDLPAFIKDLRRHRFTCFVGLNTLFASLCHNQAFRLLDFSALRSTFAGGMALQLATAECWKEMTGCAISEGYGMTETSPVVSVNPFQRIQPGTIGIPVPSTLCKVIDEQGETLPVGMAGELCVKGPQVMLGYWQRPEATAQVLDADGWLKTGDIAVIQADGYMRIVDRKKDMILVSGFNVYPSELEDVLATLPGVMQCAAIGVPDEKSGEAIKLFVVPRPGTALTSEDVLQHMKDNLTAYKRPKYIEFRESLPISNVGKILRRELRDEELIKLRQRSKVVE